MLRATATHAKRQKCIRLFLSNDYFQRGKETKHRPMPKVLATTTRGRECAVNILEITLLEILR